MLNEASNIELRYEELTCEEVMSKGAVECITINEWYVLVVAPDYRRCYVDLRGIQKN